MRFFLILCGFLWNKNILQASFNPDEQNISRFFSHFMEDAKVYYARIVPLVQEYPLAHQGLEDLMTFFYTPGTPQPEDPKEEIEKRWQWLERRITSAETDELKTTCFKEVIEMHLKMDAFKKKG